MYRIFLADADAVTREIIRAELAAQPDKYQIIGEATDGEIALPLIRDLLPDILIADLRLPFVDGLTLCRLVCREFPWMRAVLLSGFDDPGHARAAEELEVEYLLKPVNLYELQEAVDRASAGIEQSMRTLSEKICRAYSNTPLQRRECERMLCEWLRGGDGADLCKASRGGRCRLLTLMETQEERVWLAGGILRLLEQETGHTLELCAFDLPGGPALVTVGWDLQELEDFSYRVAYTIQCAIAHFTGSYTRVQISPCVDDLEGLRRACLDAADLSAGQTDARPIFGEGDALRRCPGHRGPVNVLTDCLLCADEAEITALTNRLWRLGDAWSETAASGAALLVCELREEREGPLSPEERERVMADWPPQRECGAQVAQLIRALKLRDAMAPELSETPLSRARYYLARAYGKPGIPIHATAREAGMSVGRFSVVFAQEMGISFSEYLLNMRLGVARMLLTATRMRPSTIAQRVGYADLSHFDNLFRRYVGADMKEYRRLYGKAQK